MPIEKRPEMDFLNFIKESQYYQDRKKNALSGEETEAFIEELEILLTTVWNAMLKLADDLDKLKDSLKQTESEKTRLQEMVIDQLFDKVRDGPTQ